MGRVGSYSRAEFSAKFWSKRFDNEKKLFKLLAKRRRRTFKDLEEAETEKHQNRNCRGGETKQSHR